MRVFFVFILLSTSLYSACANLPKSLDDIMGVWNGTLLDIALEGDRDNNDYWIRIRANGERYIGFHNSVVIQKIGDNYLISCEGQDRIIRWYIENYQIIFEVESVDESRRELLAERGKIGVNFITDDIIYFILLEG